MPMGFHIVSESEKQERGFLILMNLVPASVWINHDSESKHITCNRLPHQYLRASRSQNVSRSLPDKEMPPFRTIRDGRIQSAINMLNYL